MGAAAGDGPARSGLEDVFLAELREGVFAAEAVTRDAEWAKQMRSRSAQALRAHTEALEAAAQAEEARWAAEAVAVVAEAAEGQPRPSLRPRIEQFREHLSRFESLLGGPIRRRLWLVESRDWNRTEELAEALVAGALGVDTPASMQQRIDGPDAARWGLWAEVTLIPLSDDIEEPPGQRRAAHAWTVLCAYRDGDREEIAAGVFDVYPSGALTLGEPLVWTEPGLRWALEQGLPEEALTAPEAGDAELDGLDEGLSL